MRVDPRELDRVQTYRWLTACVVPRPIAWVSTLSPDDVPNLAPFSFFGGVTSDPPTVMVSVGRSKGRRKDTSENLIATKEAVIHIPTRSLAEKMVATSAAVDAAVDEFDLVRLGRLPAEKVRPFRVREAAIALEAKVIDHREVGHAPVDMFLLEVVLFHVDDAVLERGLPSGNKLRAVGRLGGAEYTETRNTFAIARPSAKKRAGLRDVGRRIKRKLGR